MTTTNLKNELWALRFTLADAPCQFRFSRGGSDVLCASLTGQTLQVTAIFSFSEKPLTLCCTAAVGDEILFVYRPWRMELWCGGALMDEEWPYGEPGFLGAELCECAAALELSALNEKDGPAAGAVLADGSCAAAGTVLSDGTDAAPSCGAAFSSPTVLGNFTGAEGWRPGGGVFAGDTMPYSYEGRYHLIYLKDRRHHGSKWSRGAHQWAHISSADLQNWDIHPMVVEITDPAEASICTGSWICHEGRHQLYYTIRTMDDSPAPIGRSLSADGYHYQKDASFRFTLSDRYTGASARDPKVIRGADGMLHMFVTTRLTESRQGCLAHLTSPDGEKWTEQEPIYVSPVVGGPEPECSDYFFFKGKYYLIFSEVDSKAEYRYSDSPFDNWQTPAEKFVPCHHTPKAAIWNDRIIFAGFIPTRELWGGTLTFVEAVPDEKGELRYAAVKEMQA